ncbi:MAG: site-specific integrase, partial [Nitrososphaeria archaeon]|nr:site-specific integrase [Nitrososphaeria archaeon]NIQ34256.1 site-specific integrase [Nitrososphaeria archaeon]
VPQDLDFIKRFIEDCRLRGFSSESMRSYRSHLLTFNKFLFETKISITEVDRDILRDFLHYLIEIRRISQKTLENYFASLSSFYEYLAYEKLVDVNPVLPVRKRYLQRYKVNGGRVERKLLSIEEMANLINSILDVRDKAIVTFLAKTGIRRGELIDIDVDDIDWVEQSITLKPKKKR